MEASKSTSIGRGLVVAPSLSCSISGVLEHGFVAVYTERKSFLRKLFNAVLRKETELAGGWAKAEPDEGTKVGQEALLSAERLALSVV